MAIAVAMRPRTGPNRPRLRIGDLARAAGVSADTIRHYERKGVLTPSRRSANGYREYEEPSLRRLRIVRRALALGFTLDELASAFRVRERGELPCGTVYALVTKKLELMDEEIAALTKRREGLVELMGEWDARLAVTPEGRPAGLLEVLSEKSGSGDERSRARRRTLRYSTTPRGNPASRGV